MCSLQTETYINLPYENKIIKFQYIILISHKNKNKKYTQKASQQRLIDIYILKLEVK